LKLSCLFVLSLFINCGRGRRSILSQWGCEQKRSSTTRVTFLHRSLCISHCAILIFTATVVCIYLPLSSHHQRNLSPLLLPTTPPKPATFTSLLQLPLTYTPAVQKGESLLQQMQFAPYECSAKDWIRLLVMRSRNQEHCAYSHSNQLNKE
jgi:hypothetical protein